MEEKIIRKLNWMYYGTMVLALIALTAMYYMTSKGMMETIDPLSSLGSTLQYVMIFSVLVLVPYGLYLVKWQKPATLEKYELLATQRVLVIGLLMTPAIIIYYLLGCYKPMIWLVGITAIAWYFTKPSLGKLEREMEPEDPNEEKY